MTDNNTPHSRLTTATKVVVIGGGYAGTLAANRLQRSGINITLVNPRPKFVQRLRLHQFAAGTGAGPDAATADYGTLLGDGVHLVVDSATASTPLSGGSSWRLGARWTTTTSSTPSAAPPRCRPACPVRANSLIPWRNSSTPSGCA